MCVCEPLGCSNDVFSWSNTIPLNSNFAGTFSKYILDSSLVPHVYLLRETIVMKVSPLQFWKIYKKSPKSPIAFFANQFYRFYKKKVLLFHLAFIKKITIVPFVAISTTKICKPQGPRQNLRRNLYDSLKCWRWFFQYKFFVDNDSVAGRSVM